jgi:rhodanese-related sulfurtransferase
MKRALPLKPMALVFLLATVLGLVYNRSTPLGVRMTEEEITSSQPSNPTPGSFPRQRTGRRFVQRPLPQEPRNDQNQVAVILPDGLTNPPVVLHPPAPAPSPTTTAPVQYSVPEVSSVTWSQAKEQMRNGLTVIVDARAANYFAAGHIPDAVSMPPTSGALEFAAFVAQYPPQTSRVIVYCGAEACGLSKALATRLLNDFGYKDVKVMPGGYAEYQAAEGAQKSAEQK